jgi:hypothetical protein
MILPPIGMYAVRDERGREGGQNQQYQRQNHAPNGTLLGYE